MRRWFYVFVALAALTHQAQAEDSSASLSGLSSSSSSDADSSSSLQLPEFLKNKKFEEDTSITDTHIRAEEGALSRYSVKMSTGYFGPAVGDLSNKDQPNPDHKLGNYETALSGSIGARYRLDNHAAINFGTGLKAIHPLNGWDRTDVSNPSVAYDRVGRNEFLQYRNSLGLSYTTTPGYVQVGQVGGVGYDFTVAHDIGMSRYSVGVDGNMTAYYYDRPYQRSDKRAARGNVGLFPGVKYNQTDKLSWVTSTGLSWMAPRWVSNQTTLYNNTVTQRVGLSYLYSHDIYLSPYLQMYPGRLAEDMTTLNFMSIISL